jgi:putative sterol carrier protein
MLADPEERHAEFTYRGSYSDWKRLVSNEIDPTKGFIKGPFKLKGDRLKAMRAAAQAKQLVITATTIPTEFL